MKVAHLYATYIKILTVLSKCEIHGNHVFRIFAAFEFLLLYCHEKLIRNNGLMSIGVEIPIYETMVFDLGNASADRLLKQHTSCIFFVGEQLVNCFPVPYGFACWGWDALPLQTRSDFPQAVTGKIPLKYPAYNLGLVGIYHQLAI